MTETTPEPPDTAPPLHPWRRMVAIGDSFTEGIGDPDPGSPGGHRGWADRVAEELDRLSPGLSSANLAIRGRLFRQIVDEQVEPAPELTPDLVTICAGGNDMLRPGGDPDRLHFSPLGPPRDRGRGPRHPGPRSRPRARGGARPPALVVAAGPGRGPRLGPPLPAAVGGPPDPAHELRRTSSGAQVRPKRPHFGTATVPGGGIAPGDGTRDGDD